MHRRASTRRLRNHFAGRRQRFVRVPGRAALLQGKPSQRVLVGYGADSLTEPFRVAIVGREDYFGDYCNQLAQGLRAVGLVAFTNLPIEEVFLGSGDDAPHAVVVVGLHEQDLPRAGRHGRAVLAAVQTEQLATPRQGAWAYGALRLGAIASRLRNFDLVFDWSREQVSRLALVHPSVAHLPHGYLDLGPEFARSLTSPELVDDGRVYDVAFIGSLRARDGRRRKIIEELGRRFRINPSTSGVWGAEKVAALNSSRVVLNLHVEASGVFESPRFFETLGLGRPLVSEGVIDPFPFVGGEDFVEAHLPAMVGAIENLLNNPAEAAVIAARGQRTARAYNQRRCAGVLATSLISAHRAIGGRRPRYGRD